MNNDNLNLSLQKEKHMGTSTGENLCKVICYFIALFIFRRKLLQMAKLAQLQAHRSTEIKRKHK